MRRLGRIGAGRDRPSWPVLLLLLTVLIPSIGIVWMMRAAIQNERLAVRQRLDETYRLQLQLAKRAVHEGLQSHLESIDRISLGIDPTLQFHAAVTHPFVDGAIIFDNDGRVLYPATAMESTAVDELANNDAWNQAIHLEYHERDLRAAADAYAKVASAGSSPSQIGRAEQGHVRCLMTLGEKDKAVDVLLRLSQRTTAYDPQRRSLSTDAGCLLLELLPTGSSFARQAGDQLLSQLTSYQIPAMPSSQRIFAMRLAGKLVPSVSECATLAAEEQSSKIVELLDSLPATPNWLRLADNDVWVARTPNQRILIAMHKLSLRQFARQVLEQHAELRDKSIEMVLANDTSAHERDASNSPTHIELKLDLPGWRLTLPASQDDAMQTARERTTFFTWVATAVLGVTFALTGLIVGQLRRQTEVARLKNDLVATISHELRTPLASIRLLVDTLLEQTSHAAASSGECSSSVNAKTVRDYLQLISSENARLTRLIDNFLTFSRMEQGKQQFSMHTIDVAKVAEMAAGVVRDKFRQAKMTLEIATAPSCFVEGDGDALTTVVVNLLDNAVKYAGDGSHVELSVTRHNGMITTVVQDNGAGLSPHACRHVFDRFYQVDQQLSRHQGGCGLGLSIVKYIVEAHGGTITVTSRPQEGCRFAVQLASNDPHEGSM